MMLLLVSCIHPHNFTSFDLYRLAHDAACAAGYLHRDLSPGNIIIVDGHGYLIDWDFAKSTAMEAARRMTCTVCQSISSCLCSDGQCRAPGHSCLQASSKIPKQHTHIRTTWNHHSGCFFGPLSCTHNCHYQSNNAASLSGKLSSQTGSRNGVSSSRRLYSTAMRTFPMICSLPFSPTDARYTYC